MRCRNPSCDKQDAYRFCGRCGLFAYCSRTCQQKHWRLHRLTCNKPSSVEIFGYQLTVEEDAELRATPPSYRNQHFDDWQLRTRAKVAEGVAAALNEQIPAGAAATYAQYPTYAFYENQKKRPTRVFGALGYDSSGPVHLHTVTLKKDGSSYFTVGGTPAEEVSMVASWKPAAVTTIKKSAFPGIFLDPLGNDLASQLADETGYSILANNLCSCCCHNGYHLPADRPVLLSAEHVRSMTERCAECGKLRRCRLCGRCKQVKYCSEACQEQAWPKHKHVCVAP